MSGPDVHPPSPLAAALASTAADSASLAPADETEHLDRVFEQILELIEEGCEIDIESLASSHVHLRPQIEHFVQIARGVAVGPSEDGPATAPPGYTFIAEIGRGGMGTVYLARQERASGRPVALKYLRPLSASAGRERLRREAEVIAGLQHRHVVPVYDVVRADDALVLVMEYIAGGSLQDVLRALETEPDAPPLEIVRRALGAPDSVTFPDDYPRLIARWGLEVADALHAVHAAGLLHRDVKPSNILLRGDATALLSDFGLVRDTRTATVTATGAFAGTAAYSAPEQLRADHRLDARADIYALGATLFHALTLRKPYSGDSAVQVLLSQQCSPGPRFPNRPRRGLAIPPQLQAVVLKALDPEPKNRYTSAAHCAEDLARFLADRPVLARRATWWTHARQFLKRNRRAVLSAAAAASVVALAALVIGAGAILVPRWRTDALAEARTIQLAPGSMNMVINYAFYRVTESPGLDARSAPDVMAALARRQERSLHAYDRAIRLGERSREVYAEREAAAALLAALTPGAGWTTHADANVQARIAQFLRIKPDNDPRIWDSLANLPSDRHVDLGRFDALGLRQLALATQALGDGPAALAAWEELERRGATDAFAAGALGIAYLYNDQPALAYARLERAARDLPAVTDFRLYLADAALACGDLVRTRQLLNELSVLPSLDRMGHRRLSLLLRWDEGDHAGALATARQEMDGWTTATTPSPLLGLQLLRRLEATDWSTLGATEDDLARCAVVAAIGAPVAEVGLRAAHPWLVRLWNRLDDGQRRRNVLTMLGFDAGAAQAPPWWAIALGPLLFSHNAFADPHAPSPISDAGPPIDIGRAGLVAIGARLSPLVPIDPAIAATMSLSERDQLAQWVLTGGGDPPPEIHHILQRRTSPGR